MFTWTSPAFRRLIVRLATLVLLISGSQALCAQQTTLEPSTLNAVPIASLATAKPDDQVTDESAIRVLHDRCVACHGRVRTEADLRLDDPAHTWNAYFDEGFLSQDPTLQGRLVEALEAQPEAENSMPPDQPLSSDESALLISWFRSASRPHPPQRLADLPSLVDLSESSGAVTSGQPDTGPQWITSDLPLTRPALLSDASEVDLSITPTLASRMRLLRRVWFDLTGLPPDSHELRSFGDDARPDALARRVDQLMASPAFGERWARVWMDQVRYGDTEGFDIDQPRPNAWRFRTWIIEALNEDMPFDQFTAQQLAGDLLASDSTEPHVGTGFYVQTPRNTEAGADRSEDQIRRSFDRIETVGDVWLGVQLKCARCHDHPSQPFTQVDYYRWLALLRNLQDTSIVASTHQIDDEFARKSPEYERRRASLAATQQGYRTRIAKRAYLQWLRSVDLRRAPEWMPLAVDSATAATGEELHVLVDQSVLATGPLPDFAEYQLVASYPGSVITAIRLEALPHESLPHHGPGRAPDGTFDVSRISISLRRAQSDDEPELLKLITPWTTKNDGLSDLKPVVTQPDADSNRRSIGWRVTRPAGERQLLIAELETPVSIGPDDRLEISIYQSQDAWMQTLGRLRVSATSTALPFLDSELKSQPWSTTSEFSQLAEHQGAFEHFLLRDEHDRNLRESLETIDSLWPERPDSIRADVVQENREPLPTTLFLRGEYELPGEIVEPGIPVWFKENLGGETPDRKGLSDWLFNEASPLVARVTAARVLQRLTGERIIAPEAADPWNVQPEETRHRVDELASCLNDSAWSLKQMIRSAVLQQHDSGSASIESEIENRQLESEMIRDSLLFASILLNRSLGGRSIVLPQPLGRSEGAFSRAEVLAPAVGQERYVRGLYVWWQRTSPFPLFAQFGTPTSSTCETIRDPARTAQQALSLLNDPHVYDHVRHLALRIWMDGNQSSMSDDQRLDETYLSLIGRYPSDVEREHLLKVQREFIEFYRVNPDLVTGVLEGMLSLPESTDERTALAAWIMLTRIIVNSPDFLLL